MQKAEKKVCSECSDAPVIHFLNKITVACDALMVKILAPFSFFAGMHFGSGHFFDWTLPLLFKILTALRVGNITRAPDTLDTMRTKTMWIAASERDILLWQFRLFNRPINAFVAEYKGETIVFEALPRPKNLKSKSVNWMDDKGKIKKVFSREGIPTARGGSFFSYWRAFNIFQKLEKPVIVKPSFGSRSRHTTIHIETEEEFKKAWKSAKQLSPFVIVEEELRGPVFRVSLIGGKVAGVLRRDGAFVLGDGARNIQELIVLENKNPKRQGVFHSIPIDAFTEKELTHQKLSFSDVPKLGQKISLHSKVGRSQGGTNTNIRSLVHQKNNELFEHLALVLRDPLIGVDFIIENIDQPWQEQERCGVIECNAIPFLDLHHFPYEGETIDAMGALWEVVFPKSKFI